MPGEPRGPPTLLFQFFSGYAESLVTRQQDAFESCGLSAEDQTIAGEVGWAVLEIVSLLTEETSVTCRPGPTMAA